MSVKALAYKIFVGNRVIKFIASPALGIAVPPVLALYYGTLDIWGDDWGAIKNNRGIHEVIFLVSASLTVLVLFLRGMSEALEGRVQRKYQEILEATMAFMNELVKKKKDRFHKKAGAVKPRTDTFKLITHPRDQLEFVIDGTLRLLKQAFDIDPKNIEITIIEGEPAQSKWWYFLKSDQQRQHTKAKTLMDGKSTARYCLDTGESLFVPDIRKGIKEEVFLSTSRSSKSPIGSIYCKPIRVSVANRDFVYLFTVCVYGEMICTPYDIDECRACERLLDEVAERVELELCLHSIKNFRENGVSNP